MNDTTDTLRIIESPVMQSSEGNLAYSVDHAGWFPDDVTSITSLTLTVKNSIGEPVTGKATAGTIAGLVTPFTLTGLTEGTYQVYGKATANTGDVDTWRLEVYVPY